MDKTRIKSGERVRLNDLLNFIDKNLKYMGNQKTINITQENEEIKFELERVNFQDIKKVNYFPPSLNNILKLNSDNQHKYSLAGVLPSVHYGYRKMEKKIINISLLSSIVTCLKQTFLSQPTQYQISYISCVLERLIVANMKNDLFEKLTNGIFDKDVINNVCDFFHINIFILDVVGDKIYKGFKDYIPFKKTVLLLKFQNDVYQPLFNEQTRCFTYNDPIIQDFIKLYEIAVEDLNTYLNIEEIDKQIKSYNERVTKYQNYKNAISGDTVKQADSSNNTEKEKIDYDDKMNAFDDDINSNSNEIKYKLSDLKLTLKLTDLQKIAGDLHIDFKNKKKSDLMTELKSLLK